MNQSELLAKQRTTLDLDNIRSYAYRVRKYFKPGDHVIDLGCGFGLVDLVLNALMPGLRFTMLDLTGNDPHRKMSAGGYAHNDLETTRQVAKDLNALVVDVNEYRWNDPADIVMSTLSWGWHYPIKLYIDQVLSVKPRTIITDLRKKQEIGGYEIVDRFTINRKEKTHVFEVSGSVDKGSAG